MPNTKSAKKRVKVIKTKTLHNKALTSALRTAIKKANAAIDGNTADKNIQTVTAIKKIDQAASKGILHKNTAARKKSALTRRLNSANA